MALAISWELHTVEEAGYSTWASLATSPSGAIAVAYFSSLNHALRYAQLGTGATWALETVDTVFGDCAPSLTFRLGRPCVSYGATTYPDGDTANPLRELRYAARGAAGTAWRKARAAATDARDSSIAIDSSHHSALSYCDKDRAVAYTRPDSSLSVWVGSAIDVPETGRFNTAAFDAADRLAVAYSARENGTDWIRYALFDGGQWSRATIGEGGGWISLAFAPAGPPAVVYILKRGLILSVVYATPAGTAWQRELLASAAGSPSLAFSPLGEPAVSYHDESAQAIKLAMYVDREWQHVLVEQSGKDQQGLWHGDFTLTSLAFTPSGQPAVAYYDRHNGTIRVAVGTITSR